MSLEKTIRSFRDSPTGKKAAEFLGVSLDIPIHWDEYGEAPSLRHLLDGYRLRGPKTLEALPGAASAASCRNAHCSPRPDAMVREPRKEAG